MYSAGVARFLSQLQEASRITGKDLYCPERIRQKLADANLGTTATRDMVAASLLDRSAHMPSGSSHDHYTSLSLWLGPHLTSKTFLFDLTTRTKSLFRSLVSPRWGCILWSEQSSAGQCRTTIQSGLRALNDPALGLRAFLWSAVEVRLYAAAHATTTLEDSNGKATFPSHWFDGSENGLTEEASDRLTLITFESISHHAGKHCYVLRQDGREVCPEPTS